MTIHIFTQNNLIVHVTCDQKNFDAAYPKIKDVIKKLSDIDYPDIEYKFLNYETGEAFFTTLKVNANAMIVPVENLELMGYIYVFETFMNKNYLMRNLN